MNLPPVSGGEAIAMIHGLGGHRWLMSPLARRLCRAEFEVHNFGYRSLLADIETHAERFGAEIDRLETSPHIHRFHIVAHSMGALITRCALLERQPKKLGRVVLLCPPNRGSHVAAIYAPWLGWVCKTLVQLSDAPGGFTERLNPSIAERYEVGIIAASRDFVVRAASTHLPHAKQHTVVNGFHSSMLFNPRTADLIVSFLRRGAF